MLLTFDTNVMIWAVQKVAKRGQEYRLQQAAALMDWIDRHGHNLVFIADVVSEFLVGDDESRRERLSDLLETRFAVLPFDTKAARIAAKLKSHPEFLKQFQQSGKSRACIKADVRIVATAVAHGVERVYSTDPDVRKFADRCGLSCSGLPIVETQDPDDSPKVIPPDRRQIFLSFPEDDAFDGHHSAITMNSHMRTMLTQTSDCGRIPPEPKSLRSERTL